MGKLVIMDFDLKNATDVCRRSTTWQGLRRRSSRCCRSMRKMVNLSFHSFFSTVRILCNLSLLLSALFLIFLSFSALIRLVGQQDRLKNPPF